MISIVDRQRMAEDEIVCALDCLTPFEMLAALTETMSLVLADNGVTPGTPAFNGFVSAYLDILPRRVSTLHREKLASAN